MAACASEGLFRIKKLRESTTSPSSSSSTIFSLRNTGPIARSIVRLLYENAFRSGVPQTHMATTVSHRSAGLDREKITSFSGTASHRLSISSVCQRTEPGLLTCGLAAHSPNPACVLAYHALSLFAAECLPELRHVGHNVIYTIWRGRGGSGVYPPPQWVRACLRTPGIRVRQKESLACSPAISALCI